MKMKQLTWDPAVTITKRPECITREFIVNVPSFFYIRRRKADGVAHGGLQIS